MGLTANEVSPLQGTGGSNPLASATQLNSHAPVAQRIEHLTTDQKVRGSNPFGRTLKTPSGLGRRGFCHAWATLRDGCWLRRCGPRLAGFGGPIVGRDENQTGGAPQLARDSELFDL